MGVSEYEIEELINGTFSSSTFRLNGNSPDSLILRVIRHTLHFLLAAFAVSREPP